MSLPENLKQSLGKCNPNHIAILKYGFQNHFLDSADDKQSVPLFDFQCNSEQISSSTSDTSSTTTSSDKNKSAKCQECKICGRVLSSLASYYVHMKSHSDNKPYRCTYCEICFTRKPYLEVHLRTHTGERPFKCTLCDKSFTQKSSLNTHLRVHSGDKPFTCEICNKTFALKSYLSAHRWSHVGEAGSGVSCDLCGEAFTSRPQAAAHIRTHTAFACSLCHRSFTKQSFLVRHVARAHPEKKYNPHRFLSMEKRRKLLEMDDDDDRSDRDSPPPPVLNISSRPNPPFPMHRNVTSTQNMLNNSSPHYDRSGRDSPLMTPNPPTSSLQSKPPKISQAHSINSSLLMGRNLHSSNVLNNQTPAHPTDNSSKQTSTTLAAPSRVTPSPMPQSSFNTSPSISPHYTTCSPVSPTPTFNQVTPSDTFPNRSCSLSPVQTYHIMVPTPCHSYPSSPYPPVTTPPPHRPAPSLYNSHLNRVHQRSSQ